MNRFLWSLASAVGAGVASYFYIKIIYMTVGATATGAMLIVLGCFALGLFFGAMGGAAAYESENNSDDEGK